eukprot:1054166-Rhodomonas_salina.1
MGVALRLLPVSEAFGLVDAFVVAAGGEEGSRKSRKRQQTAAALEEAEWECVTEGTVLDFLAPALELTCAVCDVARLPGEAGAMTVLLEAVRESLLLFACVLRACRSSSSSSSARRSELLGSEPVRAEVVKAAARIFAVLKRRAADL